MKIVGVGRSTGEFEGYKYDNFVVHALETDKNVTGQRANTVKVKSDIFHRDLSAVADADMSKLLGLMVEFAYDRFGKVQSISIVSSK